LYGHLRRHYTLEASVPTREAMYRILHRLPGGPRVMAGLRAARRLPGDTQYVRNGTTPEFGPGVSAAQTAAVTEFDLSAVTLLVGSRGPWPQEIDLVLRVLDLKQGASNQMLAEVPLAITLRRHIEQVVVEFAPIAGTLNQKIVLDIRGNETGDSPFMLFWHRPAADQDPSLDFYPAGQAFWNREPVGGDLFFELY